MPKPFEIPEDYPQEFWCDVCDNVIVKSAEPNTGKFFSRHGHVWNGINHSTPMSEDYLIVVWAVCSDCLRRKVKIMSYQVFDNGKPAQHPDHNVHESWSCSIFDTLQEAQDHANHWLGTYSPGRPLELNEEFDLYGTIIEIREVSP